MQSVGSQGRIPPERYTPFERAWDSIARPRNAILVLQNMLVLYRADAGIEILGLEMHRVRIFL
jgi:hypothetical protein